MTEIGGEGEKVNTIKNYRAINSKTHEADVVEEIATADLVRNTVCYASAAPFSSLT